VHTMRSVNAAKTEATTITAPAARAGILMNNRQSDGEIGISNQTMVRLLSRAQFFEQQSALQGMPLGAVQRSLGNRAVARLFQDTLAAADSRRLSRKCSCGEKSEEPCAECGKNRAALQPSVAADSGVVQSRREANSSIIQRACAPAASCVAPPGSATTFGAQAQSGEAAARARRGRMSPARQRATGHTGHARALETFLNAQAPGLLANIHGIFIDQDMDPSVEASTQDCASMVPPILGATKPCVFVHGNRNQEALLIGESRKFKL
jgi:hypothetical protein